MAEPIGSALLAVYRFAGKSLTPFLPGWLDRRARRGLEDPARRPERLGIASAKPPHDRVIWVHAASVGETKSVLPLVERLNAEGWFVVLTTITVTGAATANGRPPDAAQHQFAPVDIDPMVARFLDHWQPKAAIFVESEVWPVTTDQLSSRSIPHIVVNARMSERSFGKWRLLGGAPRRLFGRVALVLAQTESDAERWAALGAKRAVAVGNLKFDVPPLECDQAALDEFRRELGDRAFWLAASTHPGEEEQIVAAHQLVREQHPDVVTAIVPRHPARGPEIATAIDDSSLSIALRSRDRRLFSGGGVLVADTLGELGLFYRLADIAFLGGSLVPHGGHNPIEPVALDCVVVHGPHTANFAAIFAALEADGGCVAVDGPAELAAAVSGLLGSTMERRRYTEAAARALMPFAGALDRTLDEIRPLLTHRPVAAA